MYIKDLNLIHYRNYDNEKIDFENGINIIVGKNAQGKTNLIEAIYLLSRGYSHRATNILELSQWEYNDFFLNAQVVTEGVKHKLTFKNQNGKRQFKIDDKIVSKNKKKGIFNTILFEPDDLKIVKEGPDKRRRFLNQEISGCRPEYYYLLKDYEKVLVQRNVLLKNIQYQPSLKLTLDSWDEQLVDLGTRIMNHRIRYLYQLNRESNSLHKLLTDGKENLTLYYQNNIIKSLGDMKEISVFFKNKLKESQKDDIKKGSTNYGPHVDDILIEINGKEARRYGSQGQQRSAAISLKLAQIEIYKDYTKEYPVVLLDDIFSELDENRSKRILLLLNKTQAFITCTEDVLIKTSESDLKNNVISIDNGKVLETHHR